MTGPEHYRKAEEHLAEAAEAAPDTPWERSHLAAAQIHATLALTAHNNPHPEPEVDHARLTITRHPNGEQCEDLMTTHLATMEPINLPDIPDWVLSRATRLMCLHPDHRGHFYLPVDLSGFLNAMGTLNAVVITAKTDDAIYYNLRGLIPALLANLDEDGLPDGHDTAVLSLTEGTLHTRKGLGFDE
ncbi:MAG UNVERIFIED_CONTAM: hypothetical protein LOD86_04755 [Thermobifida fusca]